MGDPAQSPSRDVYERFAWAKTIIKSSSFSLSIFNLPIPPWPRHTPHDSSLTRHHRLSGHRRASLPSLLLLRLPLEQPHRKLHPTFRSISGQQTLPLRILPGLALVAQEDGARLLGAPLQGWLRRRLRQKLTKCQRTSCRCAPQRILLTQESADNPRLRQPWQRTPLKARLPIVGSSSAWSCPMGSVSGLSVAMQRPLMATGTTSMPTKRFLHRERSLGSVLDRTRRTDRTLLLKDRFRTIRS